MTRSLEESLYELATGGDSARLCRDIPDDQCNDQPRNFVAQTVAQTLSKSADALADPKIVLPWLIGAVGAPGALIGLLVPIRESLALLPQILVGGVIRRFAVRKGFWALGSLVEGLCVAAMAGVALAGITGAAAGWIIVGLLVVFSLARGVASIASKDTLGKTVSKTRRGRVNGYSATAAGGVAFAVGLYLALAPAGARPDWALYALLLAAAAAWALGAAWHMRVQEYPGATEGGRGLADLIRDQGRLLAEDAQLQLFLTTRALMAASSLLGPLFVLQAQAATGRGLDGLGWLMLASGLAAALSSGVWGHLSDRSSRATMLAGAALAGAAGLAALAAPHLAPDLNAALAFHAGLIFVLGIAHAGVRIGRKTHIVDMAGPDKKTEYVALSNTVIGVVLLGLGALSGAVMTLGAAAGIALLTAAVLAGVAFGWRLRDAQTDG
jgi:predicted MFS family arabinose efflux permease